MMINVLEIDNLSLIKLSLPAFRLDVPILIIGASNRNIGKISFLFREHLSSYHVCSNWETRVSMLMCLYMYNTV